MAPSEKAIYQRGEFTNVDVLADDLQRVSQLVNLALGVGEEVELQGVAGG